MKNVRQETLSVTAANQAIDTELASGMWAFIIKALKYPELEFNQKTDSILYMGYVPFLELAKEYLAGIEEGTFDVRNCECCADYFDINKTDGIYGNPDQLEEFICFPCAEKMTARKYYERFIERQPA